MKRPNNLRKLGAALLLLSLATFVWLTGGAVAYGWMLHADHYGAAFQAYGKLYNVCAGGMTLAVLLYFCKKDIAAAAAGLLSYLPMLMLMLKTTGIADEKGWTGQTEQSFGRNASDVWRNGLMWNVIPLLLLLALCLTRWLSDDEKAKRAARRAEKEQPEKVSAFILPADDAEDAGQFPTEKTQIRQQATKSDGIRSGQ